MTWLALVLAATPVAQFSIEPLGATLKVELTVSGWKGDCLCLDMAGAEVAITGLPPHPARKECFLRPTKGPVRYAVNLEALRKLRDDPDYAADLGAAWLFHDAATLLHPDGVDTALRVRFTLPQGTSVATPWPQEQDGTFTVTPAQFDAGAYLALGTLRTLDEVKLPGFSARLTLVEGKKAATDAQLREWVRGALATLGTFYGGTPSRGTRPLHLVLAGMPSEDAGVFGSVLRRGDPSVMLLFGSQATAGFEGDWVAVHELFHLGNPPTTGRFPWFVEGFTTYYTELLRARSGAKPEAQAWETLASSAREYCQPEGTSLTERSLNLRVNHEWMRVYWSGACLALRLDVTIRQRSHGARSLDDVMRELRKGEPRSEAEVIAALDHAAGSPLASTHLAETKHVPMDEVFALLEPGSALRQAMTGR